MRSKCIMITVYALILLIIVACSTVPLTGRKQLNLIPANTMLSMSFQQYDDFLKQNKVSADKKNTELVKRVGGKIQKARNGRRPAGYRSLRRETDG